MNGVYDDPDTQLYVSRAMDFFGVGKVRSIYESAVELELPDTQTKVLCTRYARLERKLGEIDRARGLYIHASQFANPQQDAEFWEEWNRFEVRHGNEDTFREMLRIKRSVTASFSQMHFNMSTIELPSDAGTLEAGGVAAAAAAAGASGRQGGVGLLNSPLPTPHSPVVNSPEVDEQAFFFCFNRGVHVRSVLSCIGGEGRL